MKTRIAFVAAVLLSAGIARAASSSVSPGEERTLESGAPASAPYVDLTSCQVNSKAVTAALLQVPDEDRGTVEGASSCQVASTEAWPTHVYDGDRR